MDKITRPWRHYADFAGRSSRTEFWLFFLVFYAVLAALVGVPIMAMGAANVFELGAEPSGAMLATFIPAGLLVLAAIMPSIALAVRRLHDSDKSGWLYLLTFIPYIGWIFFLIFGFLPPTRGDNRFGHDPRVNAELAGRTANEIFG